MTTSSLIRSCRYLACPLIRFCRYLACPLIRSCRYLAKNYQNIPSSFILSHFCLSKVIYKEIWHLTISLVRSFQYLSICHIFPKYSQRFEHYGDYHIFTFFFFFFFFFLSRRGCLLLFIKKFCIRQFRWLGLVNMYLHGKKLSKYSKRFKSYSDFHKLITDGHASARL